MGRRILNDALRAIVNAERRGKATVELRPISTVMSSFLIIMKYRGICEEGCTCLYLHWCLDCEVSWAQFLLRAFLRQECTVEMGNSFCFGYIKDFQVYDPQRVGKIKVELLGRVNDCRALSYRQDVKAREIEGYTKRALRQWGYVVITTPDGVLDHEQAIRQNVGGQVLGYFH